MRHVDAMLDRLPALYREGGLVRGLLAQPAQQLEILDEDGLEVQRAHWFDATLELVEAARLGALLDIPPEPWQDLDAYRAWVHALRDARIRHGAVTRRAIETFVEEYLIGFLHPFAPLRIDALAAPIRWEEKPTRPSDVVFLENPSRRRSDRAPLSGGIEPLHQFSVLQRGLDPTSPAFLLVGLPSAPESVPVIANLTTGQAIIFLGNVPAGARLWIRPTDSGGLTAFLEGTDMSTSLRSVSGLQPGVPWEANQVANPAKPLTLVPGKNDLWFLPVAQFDALGLDRFLLALADLVLHQGRFDETAFDRALFYQDPAVLLRLTWVETEPASFAVQLPAQAVLSRLDRRREALDARDHLGFSLNKAVQKLKAAGVAAEVQMLEFRETQGQMDRLAAVLPLVQREGATMGVDRLPDAGGVFGVTSFENSTFR